jgi:hypothetical protein
MIEWIKDAWGDFSSGALMRLLAFAGAVLIGALGLALGRDTGGVVMLVGAFMALFTEAQVALSVQAGGYKVPAPDQPMETARSLLQTAKGAFDFGRLMKLVSFGVALAIALAAEIAGLPLGTAASLAGVFLGAAAAQDVASKAADA